MFDKRLVFWFMLTWALPLWAQEAIVHSVQLKPVVWPRAGLRIDFDYRFRNALPPFDREPDFGANETVRGIIPTVPPTGFIRNITNNELLLDLDHDQDFVANPPVKYKSIYDGHVVFKDLHVNTVRQSLTIPYTLTLYTYEHACSGWLIVRSCWSGQFELAGRQWSMQIIDNLNGVYDSNDKMFLAEITLDGKRLIRASACNVPKRIVLAGHTYDLSCVFQDEQGSVLLNVAFTEVAGDLGTIQIEAQGVESLSLRNEQCLVMLNPSDTNAIIPEGDYHIDSCLLKSDPNFNGYPRFTTDNRIMTVRSGQTTPLVVGTPLTIQLQWTGVKTTCNLFMAFKVGAENSINSTIGKTGPRLMCIWGRSRSRRDALASAEAVAKGTRGEYRGMQWAVFESYRARTLASLVRSMASLPLYRCLYPMRGEALFCGLYCLDC